MELMDKGSFDGIYKKMGLIDIAVVAKVALSVVEGLMYLYDVHSIIHRGVRGLSMITTVSHPTQTSSHPTFSATARAKSNYATLASLANSSTVHKVVGTLIYMIVSFSLHLYHDVSLTRCSQNESKARSIL